MKIKTIELKQSYTVTIREGSELNTYERRNNEWYVWIGESLEPIYDADDLEALFQKELSKKTGL